MPDTNDASPHADRQSGSVDRREFDALTNRVNALEDVIQRLKAALRDSPVHQTDSGNGGGSGITRP